jgi:tRNA pseudouridine55 synthase
MMPGTTHSISGFLNVDKPPGWTSSDVVAKLRSAFQLRRRGLKIGHGGTLDPIATGVLPICIGGATRLSEFVLSGSKSYLMSARLGISTDTYDSEGTETNRQDYSSVKSTDLMSALSEFRGEIDQVPPMYSAIKKDGQPLYKLARQGKTIPREPRKVEVHKLELTAWDPPNFTLKIDCGSGFYARSLANDVGQRLGCSAHMTSLRRTRAGDFHVADSLSLDALIASTDADSWTHHLVKPDHVLKQLPSTTLDDAETVAFLHGRMIETDFANWEYRKTRIRVYGKNGEFIGLARVDEKANLIHPATVFKDSIGN